MRAILAGIVMAMLPQLACGGTCDVSTDDDVKRVYKRLSGETLSDKHPCIHRSRTFVGLVRVGGFAYDRGCEWEHTIYRCRLDSRETAPRAMEEAGWGSGDPAKRRSLALAWLDEVEDRRPLDAQPERWKGPVFHAPEVSPTTAGGLQVRFWSQGRSGMLPETNYHEAEVTFARDGTPGPIRELNAMTIRLGPEPTQVR